jgi:hypothetical protein
MFLLSRVGKQGLAGSTRRLCSSTDLSAAARALLGPDRSDNGGGGGGGPSNDGGGAVGVGLAGGAQRRQGPGGVRRGQGPGVRRGRGFNRRVERSPRDPHAGFMYRPPPPALAAQAVPSSSGGDSKAGGETTGKSTAATTGKSTGETTGKATGKAPAVARGGASLPAGHVALDLTARDTEGIGSDSSQRVPLLQHGLRRVLFNKGVHTIKAHGELSG